MFYFCNESFVEDLSGKHLKVSWTGNQVFDDFLFKGGSFPGFSVTFILEYIEENYLLRTKVGDSIDIDLSKNFIGNEGAQKIVERFEKYSFRIRTPDLSYNRILSDGILNIISGFQSALCSEGEFKLIITGNYGANKSNVDAIVRNLNLPAAGIQKIAA